MAVPTLGKLKNSEKQLSQVWENQKTPKTAFPTPRKEKKRQKLCFQPLGMPKNAESCVSNPSESQKTLKVAFPTPRNAKKR